MGAASSFAVFVAARPGRICRVFRSADPPGVLVASLAATAQVGGSSLVLNGSGMRSKFFVDVYLGALYLSHRTRDAAAVLGDRGPKRVAMIFQRDVDGDKLRSAWREGFAANNPPDVLGAVEERLKAFAALFPDVREGDRIALDYVPGEGTSVMLGDKVLGQIKGEDFHQALLRVWLGDHPPTEALKIGLLGQ